MDDADYAFYVAKVYHEYLALFGVCPPFSMSPNTPYYRDDETTARMIEENRRLSARMDKLVFRVVLNPRKTGDDAVAAAERILRD